MAEPEVPPPAPGDEAPPEPSPAPEPIPDAEPIEPTTPSGRARRASERYSTARVSREGLTAALKAPLLRPLLRLPIKKVAIWAAFLGVLVALRQFFALVFLTFVISYIAASLVDRIEGQFRSRKAPVVLVFLLFVAGLTGLGFATVPRALRQGQTQLKRLDELKDAKDPGAFIKAKLDAAIKDRPVLRQAADQLSDPKINELAGELLGWLAKHTVEWVKGLLGWIGTGVGYLFLALIFSFLIVWDIPKITAGVGRLETSRIGDVWTEVAPSIATFFQLLGKAFEAQTVIAIMNTALTCIGMLALGVQGIGFLAVMVFLCSFIPIVGVFVSTVPICIVALQQDHGGIGMVIGVIVMVVIVHLVEAYILNPKIYGHHMKLHPLAVLIVLFMGQHVFGVWGLIIGVPFATYVWRHLILGTGDDPDGQAPPAEPAEAPPATAAPPAATAGP